MNAETQITIRPELEPLPKQMRDLPLDERGIPFPGSWIGSTVSPSFVP